MRKWEPCSPQVLFGVWQPGGGLIRWDVTPKSISLSVCHSVCLFLGLTICCYVTLCPSVCLTVSLSVSVCLFLCFGLFFCLSLCLSVPLAAYPGQGSSMTVHSNHKQHGYLQRRNQSSTNDTHVHYGQFRGAKFEPLTLDVWGCSPAPFRAANNEAIFRVAVVNRNIIRVMMFYSIMLICCSPLIWQCAKFSFCLFLCWKQASFFWW